MASSSSSSDYMIYHPEKFGIKETFTILARGRRRTDAKSSVEISSEETKLEGVHQPNLITFLSVILHRLLIIGTIILQRILLWFKGPLAILGCVIEFNLNLYSLNGGILGIISNLITGSLVVPNRKSANFRTILGHIDGRIDLYNTASFLRAPDLMGPVEKIQRSNPLELCMMSSKIIYENSAFVHNAVTNHWKMHMVGFYNFWNESLQQKTTQAFIFSDRAENARVIVVAFRGTEPFNAQDWCTDLDLSWLSMGEMGRVHHGFMKALGIQDSKDYQKAWPKEYKGDKDLAYYTIRDKLRILIQQHKDAKILVTGHSLGGALAILFPSLLIMHEEAGILSRMLAIYTFGQPRVGDKVFRSYIRARLRGIRYYRVIFRYDLVPRIPFDVPVSQFTHFGDCIYYSSWHKGKVTKREPNLNYFNPWYIVPMYFNAWMDVFRALLIEIEEGKDFGENFISILYRTVGFLIPGVASHSPRDYVNGGRLGRITILEDAETF